MIMGITITGITIDAYTGIAKWVLETWGNDKIVKDHVSLTAIS